MSFAKCRTCDAVGKWDELEGYPSGERYCGAHIPQGAKKKAEQPTGSNSGPGAGPPPPMMFGFAAGRGPAPAPGGGSM